MIFLPYLHEHFSDQAVDEIFINGGRGVSLLKQGNHHCLPSPFPDRLALIRAFQDFAFSQGLRLDPMSPAAGGSYQHGSFRWHCLIPPASSHEPIFTMRRHRFTHIKLEDFKADPLLVARLCQLIRQQECLIFCGPTGCGKTTLLHLMMKCFAAHARVLVIEEEEELPLSSPLWLALRTQKNNIEGRGGVSLAYLFKESLRLRPDILVMGEIRHAEALIIFEMLLTAHLGLWSTMHAPDPFAAEQRLIALGKKNGYGENFSHTILQEKHIWGVFMDRGIKPIIKNIQRIGGNHSSSVSDKISS